MDFGLGDVPIVGDIYNAARGNPDQIKAAYDKQVQASKESEKRLQDFLMSQKGAALQFYAPLQHMFQGAYGTEGIKGPQVPSAQGPLTNMYGGR